MQRFVIAIGLLALAAATACGSSQPTAVDAPVTVDIDAPGEPTLTVVASPATIARGETVTFTVTVDNYEIVSPLTNPPPKAGQGHYHYYLDDATDYTAGWTPTVTFKPFATTASGPHTMYFVLATNVHEERQPKVAATASFTVE